MAKRVVRPITSAGCLIIGDEVLNGKIRDSNSYHFARKCFNDLSIPLKKTIVCGDDETDIVESLLILTKLCDFVVTSGGIGPTHDDITYEALAAAYGLPVAKDEETVSRMHSIRDDYLKTLAPAQLTAFYRMATFPVANESTSVQKLFTDESLWVPIVGINHQVYVLPGVPQLFEKLLDALTAHIRPRVVSDNLHRFFVKTTSKESELAPYLKQLQANCNEKYGLGAVKLGSYPHMAWKINTISIIGLKDVDVPALRNLVAQVVGNIGGGATEIDAAEEERMSVLEP